MYLMRLGLLDTVPPAYYLEGEQSDPDKFRQLFAAIGIDHEFPHYEVTLGQLPPAVAACDAYLITGSPVSVYDDLPWIPRLEHFVRQCYEAGKPLVGICFGHQVIAQALGGSVAKAAQGWLLGLHDLKIIEPKAWVVPQKAVYSLYFVNQDQVVTLPPDAEWLGCSPNCPYAMFTIKDRVLCLQAHPEQPVSSMRTFTNVLKPHLPAELYRQALASLELHQPDATIIGRWIWQFLASYGAKP
jgi:GMP synthase-like glutamine amidotransferase